jgi:hypothetical protein
MAANKRSNGTNGTSNGHVSLAREEYAAFVAREETFGQVIDENARLKVINAGLNHTQNTQAQRMTEMQLKLAHLERIGELQLKLIEQLQGDAPKADAFQDMLAFWHLWQVHTKKALDARKTTEVEVAKYEPDLFRTWRNWVKDAGRVDRMFSEAGSRSEREALMPKNAHEMQEHVIVRLRQDNAKLAARIAQLESASAEIQVKEEKTP